MSDVINKKQKMLIEYMLADKQVFVSVYHILKPEYFDTPLDKVVGFIQGYFQKYMDIPDIDLIDAETEILLKSRELDRDEREYLLEELEAHCKNAAMSLAILEAVDHVNDGNPAAVNEIIRQAMLVRIDKSIGRSLYDTVDERVTNNSEPIVEYSTGIPSMDEMIGNLRKGEFGMVYAVTSGGKSLMLANIAMALSKQQQNVLVITLELKEDLYCRRFDAMITNTNINKQHENGELIEAYYNDNCSDFGSIVVKKLPAGCTSDEIDAFVMEYVLTTEVQPDAILVDYLQLMGVGNVKSTNKFDIDHEKALGLIRMGETFDAIMISAGQINRDGYDVMKPNPAHCAGGLSVINDSDWSVALVGSEEDIENNQIQVAPLKIRHAKRVTQNLTLYKNPESLRMTEAPTQAVSNTRKSLTKTTAKTEKKSPNSGDNKLRKALNMGKK